MLSRVPFASKCHGFFFLGSLLSPCLWPVSISPWVLNPSPQWSSSSHLHGSPAWENVISLEMELPQLSAYRVPLPYLHRPSASVNKEDLFSLISPIFPTLWHLTLHLVSIFWITDFSNLLGRSPQTKRMVTKSRSLLFWSTLFTKSQPGVLSHLRWLFWAVGLHWCL